MPHPSLNPVLAIALVGAFAWLGYGEFMRLANLLALRTVEAIEPQEIPFINAIRIAIMPFWGGTLLISYLLLALVMGLPIAELFGSHLEWRTVAVGFFLGVAEASFSMLLATAIFRALAPVRQAQRGGDANLEYQMLGQGGWMRSYRDAFDLLPIWLAYPVVAMPLLGEELIFRGAGIPLLMPLGTAPAVAISTLLFMIVQIYRLPSWYQSVGPLCGALVMGVCHGILYSQQGNLLPLLIAHVTFLAIIMGRKNVRQ